MIKIKVNTDYRRELKRRILDVSMQEFRSKGIKAVKMDDIATLLSVSKRTVYEIFENKEQLLMECVKEDHKKRDQHMQTFCKDGQRNVMDIILEFFRLQMRNLTGVNPVYFADLHRFPQITSWLEQKHEQVEANTRIFYQQCIEEGYFRADVNYDLISKVGNGTMKYIMETQLYQKYSLKEVFRNVIMLYIRGFCTLKGIEELERRMNQLKD